jgi:hypothetical protein
MNELELFLTLIEHMIENKLKENPKSGIKKSDSEKMKYTKMLEVLKSLKILLYDWHEDRYYSICKNCGSYEPDETGTGCYGRCKAKDRDLKTIVHQYHTCFRNTDTRWNKSTKSFDYTVETVGKVGGR